MEVTIIAGCGGGYDLFCGLSFYHELFNKHNQNNIILINYSFTEKEIINNSHNCKKLIDKCYVIDHTQINDQKYDYFPEHYLSKCLNKKIYMLIDYPTINQIIDSYKSIIADSIGDINLIDQLNIYLVDGGSDSLMTGKEKELGTPVEDIMHMKAVHELKLNNLNINKYLCILGANVDVGHLILVNDINDRIKHLENKCLISKKILQKGNDDTKFYIDIFEKCNPRNSIVNSLIIASILGHRGYYTPEHLKTRFTDSIVDLSEMTCTFYIFDLNGVIEENIYYQQIDNNMNENEVDIIIGKINGYVVY